MIRVALVISNLEFGGAQRQIVELANASRESEVRYHVVVLSAVVPLAEQLLDKTCLHVVEKRSRFDVSVIPRLARLFRDLEIDIAHGFLFDAEMATRLAGKVAGVPMVLGSERNTDYRIKPIQKLAYRLTHGLRYACVANSNAGAEFNARELGYPLDHYRVIHNGVDTSRFCPGSRADACAALGLDPGFRWIGMVGSFKPRKNHKVFLKSASELLREHDGIKFLLAGDSLAEGLHGTDSYKQEIISEIDRLRLRENIALLGNREDIEQVYRACDLTVLPSLHEGTPNVALESMACGIPVVASDVADNRLVVPDGEVGYVVPVNDVAATVAAVRRALEPRSRERQAVRAREWVTAEFGTAALASKMCGVYQEFFASLHE